MNVVTPNIREVAKEKLVELRALYPDLFVLEQEWVEPELPDWIRDVAEFDESKFYFNEDNWRMSKQGNLFMNHGNWNIVIFKYRKGGYGWRIVSRWRKKGDPEWSSRKEPYWTVRDAIRATWEVCSWWDEVG